MANNRIQNYRGTKANMPTLKVAELGFATDTRELFIGTSGGNLIIGGSQWYTGTAMSGTITTTGYYSYSACPLVKVGDIYLNTSYGYVYQCTTAGSGSVAKWTYKGNIRGKGISSTAVTYQSGTSGTSAPTGTWSTSVPSVSQGNYLWTRVVITYTDGTTGTSYSVARQGADGTNGVDGDDGVSVVSVVQTATSSADGGTNTVTVTLSDGTTSTFNIKNGSKGSKGDTGSTGATGNGISSIEIRYATSTSNTTAPSTWYTSIQTAAAGSYLWTRVRLLYTNGNYSDPYYTVARQGANGSSITGQRGSKWYTGTAMSGTSTTTGAYTWNDSEQKYVGDMYLNTTYGYVYKCTTAGTYTTAKWTYQGTLNSELLNGKAPTSHASSGTTYGEGNSSNYGHVKLSDSTSSTSGATSGVAATPYAVKQAYDRITANYINGYGTSGSWKAVYTNSGYFGDYEFGNDSGIVVLEGMGKGKTLFTFQVGSNAYQAGKTIIIKDANVKFRYYDAYRNGANFIFINCTVEGDDYGDIHSEIYKGSGNLTFINCNIYVNIHDMGEGEDDCRSGIITTGTVTVIGGNVDIAAGGTTEGFDANFIYQAGKLTMQGVTVTTSGTSTGRINIVRNCNDATITGCHFYLNGTMHSIGHIADTDKTVGGSFTGNYVEYYKTYMRFATISGNTFKHLAAGSSSANQIILQCPTCMTGNHFKGNTIYIDPQSQKVIVDRNLSDYTISFGTSASGSVTTNNIVY